MGTYCQEVNYEEIVVADLPSIGSFICTLLVKKAPDLWKKSQTSNTQDNILLMWQRLRNL